MTRQPFPPRVAESDVVKPPIPTPVAHITEVEVDGDNAMVLITAPGVVPEPASVDPPVSAAT